MTPQERLLAAAKRVKAYLEAQIAGRYIGPSEDIQAGRELAEAIAAVEAQQAANAQHQRELEAVGDGVERRIRERRLAG